MIRMTQTLTEKVRAGLLGLAVGDALGVPVEFAGREYLAQNPVAEMLSFGTHNQPAGTWSDDTSLSLCLAESLIVGFDLDQIAKNFLKWFDEAHWTAHNEIFDIGITTKQALIKLFMLGVSPEEAGGASEFDNGNGSLMRMLPLAFFVKDLSTEERFEKVRLVSSITHLHIRSIIACFYYVEFAIGLINNEDKYSIYQRLQQELPAFLNTQNIDENELNQFNFLLTENIWQASEDSIQSTGYCIASLEAALWCLFTTDNYKDCVLQAVNLGGDTDTIASIAGGLAGIIYSECGIPQHWLEQLARLEDIEQLAEQFAASLKR